MYSLRSDKEFPTGYHRLARYASVQGRRLSLTAARMFFRTDRLIVHCSIYVACDKDCFLLDDEKPPDLLFEVLFNMCFAVLHVRVSESFPSCCPNLFAH